MAFINLADAVKDPDKAKAFGAADVVENIYRNDKGALEYARRVKRERYERAVRLVQEVYDRHKNDPCFIIHEKDLEHYVQEVYSNRWASDYELTRALEFKITVIGKNFT